MEENLFDFRKNYKKGTLTKATVDKNPMQQFRKWFLEAVDSDSVAEANAMTLTTLGIHGFPKGRVVLLKKYDEYGFYFYTNYNSEKGKAIKKYSKVSLSFFWPALERQIIILGTASKTTEQDSINYFDSRPKGSRIGAIVSNQSTVVENREVLEKELIQLEKYYENKKPKKPKNWGGYLVSPISIEFWQGRPNRLHDRIRYTLQKDFNWKIERLAP
ncbi:MAG: pyridoxamine 5'-phosphate oxidase [Flavobacteriales bacterium]